MVEILKQDKKSSIELGKRNIAIKDILEIWDGRSNKNFRKYPDKDLDKLSFSIITPYRTLDLEASTETEKRLFIYHLSIITEYFNQKK